MDVHVSYLSKSLLKAGVSDYFSSSFIIFGSISITWAIIFLIFMPDLPSTARFLSPEDKVVAVERVAVNRMGIKNHTFKWYQVRQAARDPKTWILFVMAVRQTHATMPGLC
jgi:hypothetical protein